MKLFFSRAVAAFFERPMLVFLFGVALILALTGPFGTFESLSLLARIAYWTPLVLGANLVLRLAALTMERLFGKLPPLQWQLLMIVVFSTMFSPIVWAFSALFVTGKGTDPGLLSIALYVFGATAVVGLLSYFMTRNPAAQEKPVRLYARLADADHTAKIMRLTVDDHYVNIHLDDGSCQRVLMRFSDAVNEMDGTPGFCTHRSHWVASAFVAQAAREKNREFLILQDGAKVPVSKTYRENVVAAGFL